MLVRYQDYQNKWSDLPPCDLARVRSPKILQPKKRGKKSEKIRK